MPILKQKTSSNTLSSVGYLPTESEWSSVHNTISNLSTTYATKSWCNANFAIGEFVPVNSDTVDLYSFAEVYIDATSMYIGPDNGYQTLNEALNQRVKTFTVSNTTGLAAYIFQNRSNISSVFNLGDVCLTNNGYIAIVMMQSGTPYQETTADAPSYINALSSDGIMLSNGYRIQAFNLGSTVTQVTDNMNSIQEIIENTDKLDKYPTLSTTTSKFLREDGTLSLVSLSNNITGTLAASHGGTGATTLLSTMANYGLAKTSNATSLYAQWHFKIPLASSATGRSSYKIVMCGGHTPASAGSHTINFKASSTGSALFTYCVGLWHTEDTKAITTGGIGGGLEVTTSVNMNLTATSGTISDTSNGSYWLAIGFTTA